MTIRNIFFGYMALVGLVTGAIIVSAPQVTEFWLKPYFWVLIAVALFDGAIFMVNRASPATTLPMNARVIGFLLGAVLMAAIPIATGSQVSLF